MLSRVREVLTRRIRLERRGFINFHLVLEPRHAPEMMEEPVSASRPPAAVGNNRRREELPPLREDQAEEARADLRAILAAEAGDKRLLPSLALLERVLAKNPASALDEVPVALLRHAATSLDALEADRYSPGLILLRRRVGLVLRRRYGDPQAPAGTSARPDSQPGDFSDSLTEFIDIDGLFDHKPQR